MKNFKLAYFINYSVVEVEPSWISNHLLSPQAESVS